METKQIKKEKENLEINAIVDFKFMTKSKDVE